MRYWPVEALGHGTAEEEEHRIVEALLAGGDSRLLLDRRGVNKYLCPPIPAPAQACLSSCTASPISNLGFLRASAVFQRVAAAPAVLEIRRIQDCAADNEAGIRLYLGLGRSGQVILTTSGTDGMLMAASLLALEAGERPMTAILPSPSETGTGVPLAASCHAFDGPEAGRSVIDVSVDTAHIALRGSDGKPRETGAVTEEFRDAVRASRGRPVVILTHGTKTGLVAPVEVPAGVEVIVDACQLRLSPSRIRNYLTRGWPVVITASKFLGGPAFSGAVLLPAGRFSAGVCKRARAVCARLGGLAGTGSSAAASIGPLLRWSAALAEFDGAALPEDQVAEGLRRFEREAAAVVAALPGARVIDQPAGCPGIVTFAVEAAGLAGSWLSVAQLRQIYRGLADQAVLVGQPVDLGPFGGLRVAIGMRDIVRGSSEASLQRLAGAWPRAVGQGASRAKAA